MINANVIMAGFGGQGILLTGKLLAHAAMARGLEVSWLPSYGPEMRGGTANVTVCISDTPIGSPYVTKPTALLVMNQPSLEKFSQQVTPEGLIIINKTLVPITIERDDCSILYIEASQIAASKGTSRAANIVMLGALVGHTGMVEPETCINIIEREFARKAKFIPANIAAFEAGYEEGVRLRGRTDSR
jgi:2-oxoglutarate ferredoxin oxidoreductase subunit gamma